MFTLIKKTAIVLFLVAASAVPAFSETPICAECGMELDPGSKFTSRITDGNRSLSFCDIGDLFAYLNKHKQQSGRTEVRDYTTGEWIEARKTFYVSAPGKFTTPMGWGIAGFRDRDKASVFGRVMDFDSALRAAR